MPIQAWIAIALFVAGLFFALLTYLLKRSIDGVDTKIDATSKKVDGACQQVADMQLEMTGYNKLVEYLRTDVQEVKNENRVLREAHHAIDKHIAVLNAHPSKN